MASTQPLPLPAPPDTSSSSITATEPGTTSRDLEAATGTRTHVTHWKLITDPAGVTPEVLAHTYPGEGTDDDPYVVSFLDVDPHNPMTFAEWKKWTMMFTMAMATLAIAFVSTAYSGGLTEIIREFHISTELSIAGMSLFVLGFAVGPLLWAPMSEYFGRQVLFTTTYIAVTAFNGGCAGAKNIRTLLVLRFFAGAFGSSPLTNAGGVIADMFSASERGLAGAVFAAAPFLGPSLGPIASGFLGQAEGWRWVEGLMCIFTGVMLIAGTLIVPETYAPVLLRKRADKLSKITGKVYISKLDAHHLQQVRTHASKSGQPTHASAAALARPSFKAQFAKALSRPWVLLFREPIVFLSSLYMAIVYGTMYMMFPSFPIVFQQHRGWSAGIGGLAFLGITGGMVFAVAYAIWDNKRYKRVASQSPGGMAPPEARLPTAAVGSILLPIGLFWFAWTNEEPVHWIVPIIGSAFFAAGLVLVFLSLMNYLIDAYVVFAASVLAANAVLRSLFGAAFPLFTTYMYQNLGLHWAASIPAFLALACVPCPFLFIVYGKRIRMRCKFAAEAAEVLKRMLQQHQVVDETDAVEEADAVEEELKQEEELERQATRGEGSSIRRSLTMHRTFSRTNRAEALVRARTHLQEEAAAAEAEHEPKA